MMKNINANTVRNYIRKNYSINTFATKHHFKPEAISKFMEGKSISEQALRMIIGCIEVVDNHIFTGEIPKWFRKLSK
ncbi:hypothetical protein R3B00_001303 [Klebsiella pneumoniae]|nr:hypothetical protein [Klebsiella pneumoniae]ELQ8980641.1 hypothetical protein [Klebsiella pneumoniae]